MYTNTCPQCGEPAIHYCKCQLRDSICKNGHYWFYCPIHGTKIEGKADHPSYTLTCRCTSEIDLSRNQIY